MKTRLKWIWPVWIIGLTMILLYVSNTLFLEILHGNSYYVAAYFPPHIQTVKMAELSNIYGTGAVSGSIKRLSTLNAVLYDVGTRNVLDEDKVDLVFVSSTNSGEMYAIEDVSPEILINYSAHKVPDGTYQLYVVANSPKGACCYITDAYFRADNGIMAIFEQ